MDNVLVVLPTGGLGGAEQVLKMIAKFHSDKCNVEIFFLTKIQIENWRDLDSNNVEIKYINTRSFYLGGACFLLRKIFSKKTYKYVYSSQVLITGIIGLLLKGKFLFSEKFIARESTLIFDRFTGFKYFLYEKMYQIGYRKIDLLICQTDYMKNKLVEALPKLSKKINIQVIPNPVNFNDISLEGNIDESFGQFIVSAGRLIPEKGFDLLIKAFKAIKKTHPTLKLVILGEGQKRLELENLIEEVELKEDVILKGFVKNVYPYFNQAAVCVVSSRIEGFPNVLLQMMYQNTKVVSTKCAGGIEDIEGVSIAETNNVMSLANALQISLEQNTESNRIGFDKNLKERSIENFIKKMELHLSTHD
jgi:glycosyltransferase involved in cell wall biosynthesis